MCRAEAAASLPPPAKPRRALPPARATRGPSAGRLVLLDKNKYNEPTYSRIVRISNRHVIHVSEKHRIFFCSVPFLDGLVCERQIVFNSCSKKNPKPKKLFSSCSYTPQAAVCAGGRADLRPARRTQPQHRHPRPHQALGQAAGGVEGEGTDERGILAFRLIWYPFFSLVFFHFPCHR